MIYPWAQEHAEGAVAVVKAVFDEYGFTWDEVGYHADLYDVPGHYLATGCPFFVAIVDGEVVGTAALDRFPTIEGEPGTIVENQGARRIAGADCALERLYVHPSSRRAGVGSRLIERVITEAKEGGYKAMEIWSDKRFADAHRLYGRYGAEVAGDRICDDPDVSPEWGLTIRL